MTPVKVFQVGFNRCGTRSLTAFFEDSGHKTAHWEQGTLAQDIARSKAAGKRPLAPWDDTVLFTDLEYVTRKRIIEAFKDYAYLDHWYPDAIFVLNTRRVDDWLLSRINHESGWYFKKYMTFHEIRDPIALLEKWKVDWHTHLAAVRSYFANRPGKLVEFDIEKDGAVTLLAQFEGVLDLDATKWRHVP